MEASGCRPPVSRVTSQGRSAADLSRRSPSPTEPEAAAVSPGRADNCLIAELYVIRFSLATFYTILSMNKVDNYKGLDLLSISKISKIHYNYLNVIFIDARIAKPPNMPTVI